MSVRVLVKPDYPKDKQSLVKVEEKMTFGELKAAAEKEMAISLKGYAFAAVGYQLNPRDISSAADEALVIGKDDKSLCLADRMMVYCIAPANLKPQLLRAKKKKEDEKSGDGDERRMAAWKEFDNKNVIKKLKQYTEAKDAKRAKNATDYIEAYAKQVFGNYKEFAFLPKELAINLLKSDYVNAPESIVFTAALEWSKAACEAEKKDPKKADDVKTVGKDLFACVRFPLMELPDLASTVAPSQMIDQGQLLGLYTYIGQRSTLSDKSKKIALPDSLKGMTEKPRKPRMGPAALSWDSSKCCTTGLTISNENKTVTHTYGSTSYLTCASNKWISSGKWRVTYKITLNTTSTWLALGVITRNYTNYNVGGYIGESTSYGWYNGGGNPTLWPASRNYGSRFESGDTVVMDIDCTKREVSFKKNGSDYGTAFTSIPSGELCPAITTYMAGDSVTIVSFEQVS